MPKRKSKEELKHILGYTTPHGHNGVTYPIYDREGYLKYALPNLGHNIRSTFSGPIKIEIKKVIVSFD
tara:strand:+ start:2114 stop:2317 length:204 start_codon:yes stop_codon:yes gene_type:complete